MDARFLGDFRMPLTDSQWNQGFNAVFIASCFGLPTIVTKLISSGCDPNIQSSVGEQYAPFHIAVWRSDLQMIDELVKAGANLDVQDKWGLSPLHIAMHIANTTASRSITERLLKAKASTTIRDQDGDTVVHAAASHADTETLRCLLDFIGDIDVSNDGKQTALHYAVRRGETSIIEALLLAGANPSLMDARGITPLEAAVDSEDLTAVKLILQHDGSRLSPRLSEQDQAKGTKYVSYCLEQVAQAEREEEIDSYNRSHERARGGSWDSWFSLPSAAEHRHQEMWWAALKGDMDKLETLIRTKVSLDSRDAQSGNTALHEAVFTNRTHAVILLLAAGASQRIMTRRGRTARELAVVMRVPSILLLFEEEQWKRERVGGKTGLEWQMHFASFRGDPKPAAGARGSILGQAPSIPSSSHVPNCECLTKVRQRRH